MTSRKDLDKFSSSVSSSEVLGIESDSETWGFSTKTQGPQGKLPYTSDFLINDPSGYHFGMSQNAGMGWNPSELLRKQFAILSTLGGMRNPDGSPIALGLHIGHFELTELIEAASVELKNLNTIPFAMYCTDPCDGRSQGTPGMLDSLPYRNDAAQVFRRLVRSMPTARGVMGIASCDKGLPAMMMALAGLHELPVVIVPGGSTLANEDGEDTAMIQSIGARFAQGEVTLDYAQEMGCKACASPGGGCQFLGTAGTSQVIAESLGLAVTHSAISPSGSPAWIDIAKRSAKALVLLEQMEINSQQILTDAAFNNAMLVHAACGGSTNLLIHLPAIAHSAARNKMDVNDWNNVNRQIPRLVDVLPNGPNGFPTSQMYSAGGVPEVMLHLRKMGLLDTSVMTVSGLTLGENLDWWEQSKRRFEVRKYLKEVDKVDPDDVIMTPDQARSKGLTSTVTFPSGNIAPEGSVIKSTSIDPEVVDSDGVYRKIGPARVFTSESAAITAIKSLDDENKIKPGDIMVMTCGGPMGTGMEEVFQVTVALKYLSYGKEVALITDARFSGVSTGACIGHVGPEALAGGPIGKILEGDLVEIEVDRVNLSGTINLIGENGKNLGVDWGTQQLLDRETQSDLKPHPLLPDDSRLWAALQNASGGTWGGCVFDVDSIVETLEAGTEALKNK
ncbi:MAG: YjhG/YagF family D-xylonate dehydratase [Dehalococcoidia bacterium]